VTNAKAAVFNLFNLGSALLNAMTLCQLIKAIDDFNGKFGISGIKTAALAFVTSALLKSVPKPRKL
jgi:hypothetical protein